MGFGISNYLNDNGLGNMLSKNTKDEDRKIRQNTS